MRPTPARRNQHGSARPGVVALGIDDALPVDTTLSVTGATSIWPVSTSKSLGSIAPPATASLATRARHSTLTINGDEIGDFAGIIGASSSTTFPGTNDNVALVLASTNTGSLTLSNNYNVWQHVQRRHHDQRRQTVRRQRFNIAGSATGSGPVAVNNGGTLGGNGSVGGAMTVASGGHITRGLGTGTTIGTLTAFNAVSLNSGSNLDIDLGAPAPGGGTSDQVSTCLAIFGNFALTVPAAASSIGVNLSDPAGGAAGNGTYTLMTFQAGPYTGSNNASQFHTVSLPSSNSLNGSPTFAYHLADDTNTIQEVATPALPRE